MESRQGSELINRYFVAYDQLRAELLDIKEVYDLISFNMKLTRAIGQLEKIKTIYLQNNNLEGAQDIIKEIAETYALSARALVDRAKAKFDFIERNSEIVNYLLQVAEYCKKAADFHQAGSSDPAKLFSIHVNYLNSLKKCLDLLNPQDMSEQEHIDTLNQYIEMIEAYIEEKKLKELLQKKYKLSAKKTCEFETLKVVFDDCIDTIMTKKTIIDNSDIQVLKRRKFAKPETLVAITSRLIIKQDMKKIESSIQIVNTKKITSQEASVAQAPAEANPPKLTITNAAQALFSMRSSSPTTPEISANDHEMHEHIIEVVKNKNDADSLLKLKRRRN